MVAKQVLIFDSGVGGLSIFQEVIQKNGNINCFYLFDNAYYPYGELDEDILTKRLTQLLLSFVNKQHIDLIIVACNSASTVALDSLRSHLSIPVIGVVPAIKPAVKLTKNGLIGLLATPATIKNSYTTRLINEFSKNSEVLKIGSTELVNLAEEKLQGEGVDKKRLHKVFEPWLTLHKKPDTLVLGCTHFPLLKDEIASCFQNSVQLVDSGKAIANRVSHLLGEQRVEQSVKPFINQHSAYYTKAIQPSEKLISLRASFLAYGFKSLNYYALA